MQRRITMRRALDQDGVARPGRAGRRALVAAAVLGTVALSSTLAPAAAGASVDGVRATARSARVVEVVDRAPFGEMLATVRGLSLYTTPASCTGSCLVVWPPLVMPEGTRIPLGASGLGTRKVKRARRKILQVTYGGKLLYTFASDHGSSVTGQGVGGFSVARVR